MASTDSLDYPSERQSIQGPASHPSFPAVSALAKRYADQAASLFQTFVDLQHSAGWTELRAIDVVVDEASLDASKDSSAKEPREDIDMPWREIEQRPRAGWAVLEGRRTASQPVQYVVPCNLSDMLTVADFTNIFRGLDSHLSQAATLLSESPDAESPTSLAFITLALVASDMTVVYYKLARGMVKPVN